MIGTNVKTYLDGDRFIIVIENSKAPVIADKIRAFIGDLQYNGPVEEIRALEAPPDPKLNEIPWMPESSEGELPPKPISIEEAKQYIFQSGPYKGLTFVQAIERHGRSASVAIFTSSRDLPQEIGNVLKNEARKLIISDLNARDSVMDTRKQIFDFLKSYRPIADDILNDLKEKQGCRTVEDLIKFSDEAMLRNIYQTTIDRLVDRM